MDEQNKRITSLFDSAIRKLESIFRKDAQQQVELKRSEIEEIV